MWLIPSVHLLGTTPKTIFKTSPLPSTPNIRHHCRVASEKKSLVSGVRCSNSTDEQVSTQKTILERKQCGMLRGWNVPWDWKIGLYVMMPYLMSILLTGIVESAGLEGFLQPHSGSVQPPPQSINETAVHLFIDQLLKSVIKLSLVYIFVSPYQPFPEDIFSYRWSQPLNLQNGWLLWTGGGLLFAATAVFFLEVFIFDQSANQMQNKVEALVSLLPLIGASNISTASVLGILGVLAPVCEETVYRGFLLTTLTKWLPVQASVVVSSIIFSLAHQSPGKSIEIFIFGIALGLVYAQTRNLLAPITMHACWNLGVVLTLLYCQLQGCDIQKYLS